MTSIADQRQAEREQLTDITEQIETKKRTVDPVFLNRYRIKREQLSVRPGRYKRFIYRGKEK